MFIIVFKNHNELDNNGVIIELHLWELKLTRLCFN